MRTLNTAEFLVRHIPTGYQVHLVPKALFIKQKLVYLSQGWGVCEGISVDSVIGVMVNGAVSSVVM